MTPEELAVAILPIAGRARDVLLEAVDLHDSHCPVPPAECQWRAYLLGWLAHCVGASDRDLFDAVRWKFKHDQECGGHREVREP